MGRETLSTESVQDLRQAAALVRGAAASMVAMGVGTEGQHASLTTAIERIERVLPDFEPSKNAEWSVQSSEGHCVECGGELTERERETGNACATCAPLPGEAKR